MITYAHQGRFRPKSSTYRNGATVAARKTALHSNNSLVRLTATARSVRNSEKYTKAVLIKS